MKPSIKKNVLEHSLNQKATLYQMVSKSVVFIIVEMFYILYRLRMLMILRIIFSTVYLFVSMFVSSLMTILVMPSKQSPVH